MTGGGSHTRSAVLQVSCSFLDCACHWNPIRPFLSVFFLCLGSLTFSPSEAQALRTERTPALIAEGDFLS